MSAQPVVRNRPGPEPDWLTLGQAARFLGVAQSTIRKWSDDGRVRAFYTPGGHRRFRREDLESFVDGSGPGGRSRRGPLVLVVDDDARLREFLRVSLEASGYSVSEAESGEQALAAIADERPALVLLDVVMPGRRRLAAPTPARGAPRLDPGDHVQRPGRRGVGSGGSRGRRARFIGKPFDPQELLARAKQLVPA